MTILNSDNSPINIPFSKPKLILHLVLAIIFGVGGGYFVVNPVSIANSGGHHRFVLEIVVTGVICIIFSLAGIVAFASQFFSRNPGLQIDQTGITIPGIFSNTYVTWGEISRFEIYSVRRTKLINICLTDPHGFSQRQKGAITRRLSLFSNKTYGAPVSISTGNLKCSFDELYALLNDRLEAYRRLWKAKN